VLLPAGERSVRFYPRYDTEPAAIDEALSLLRAAIEDLVGGRVAPDRQTGAMWWFDPATRRFTRAGTLPRPLSDAAVVSFGHRVWLLGGEDPAVTDRVLTVSVR
jgi:hypothetical protein